MLGPEAIVNSDGGRKAGLAREKRRIRDVYREMSRAELEIIDIKAKESNRWENAKRRSLGAAGAAGEEELSDTGVDEEYRPYDETALIGALYRQILTDEPGEDARRTHQELMRDVYGHTENKTDVIRNMLASIYVKDPSGFTEKHDEVH